MGWTSRLRSPDEQARRRRARSVWFKYRKRNRLQAPSHCIECFMPGPLQAHHDDYGKPLCIRWLCLTCHVEAHRTAGVRHLAGLRQLINQLRDRA